MRRRWLPTVLFAFCGASALILSAARRAPAATATTLDEALRLGRHWYGPEITKEDLEGRVVLIEDWGYK